MAEAKKAAPYVVIHNADDEDRVVEYFHDMFSVTVPAESDVTVDVLVWQAMQRYGDVRGLTRTRTDSKTDAPHVTPTKQ